jgi:hypothetical protein
MPRYFFDISDGRRLADSTGRDFDSNEDAIARAKILAIQVSLDTPEADPDRHVAVLDHNEDEVFRVPVYSKPEESPKPRKVNLRKSI